MRFNPYGDMPEMQIWPVPWANVNGESGISVGFDVKASDFPNGITIGFVHQDGDRTVPGHDVAISATPGRFNSELGSKAMHLSTGSNATFYLRFGPIQPGDPVPFMGPQPSQDVSLPDGRYYINCRASDFGVTHAQFSWQRRTGNVVAGAPPAPAPIPIQPSAPPAPAPTGVTVPIPAGATKITFS